MANYIFTAQMRQSGVTPIPNIFIDEYMANADGNFVKVYLCGFIEAINGNKVSGDFISQKLELLESDIIKAWEYWESKGLVNIKKSSGELQIEFLNIYDVFYSNKSSVSMAATYSPEDIRSRMDNAKIKDMFQNIEKSLGRTMSAKEISMYLSWLDDYSFSPEVITLLIEYCKSKKKVDSRYFEKVAIAWHDANIASVEDAQKYITQHEEKYNKYRLILDFLGLKEHDLMKPQEEFLDKWFSNWNFSLELVLEACKICSLRINEPNFSYIDGILSNWSKQGIKTLREVETADSKKKSKNMKFKAPVNTFNSYDQRSYDIKELEKKLLGIEEVTPDE
ncbi:replication initiation and membrane attachment [Oxobacter pfennigii]|uniref:Replication initiation and membrane attachment n=2 Tax=Oxobacter pfennigii TaxID=36849 RepID=A0A0N8NSS6_9CLOT|nr:replication initiation and membrane attachment [Oxobacter pfennigii]